VKHLLALAALLAVSCGPRHPHQQHALRIRLELPQGISTQEQRWAREAVSAHLRGWEAWDGPIPPRLGLIQVRLGTSIPGPDGLSHGGYAHLGEGRLEVAAGSWWELWALTHEIGHFEAGPHNVPPVSPDPRWRRWDERGLSISAKLRRLRSAAGAK